MSQPVVSGSVPDKGRTPLNNTLIFLGLLGIIGAIRSRYLAISGDPTLPSRYKMKNSIGFAEVRSSIRESRVGMSCPDRER